MSETAGDGSGRADAVYESDATGDLAWRALKWLGLSLAALVGMAQVGAIVQEAVPTGTVSVTTLYGPGQLLSTNFAAAYSTLNAWAVAKDQFGWLPPWLYLHMLFDGLFIVGYACLGFTLLDPERESLARKLLWCLIAADVIEDAIASVAFIGITDHRHPVYWLSIALHVATMIKWLAALAFLVHVAYRAWDNEQARRAIRHLFWALWEQRFSVVVVLLLAVIAADRGSDVLEQMPDVQRSWLTWPPGIGWVHAAVAATAQLLLAILLVFLGRMRTWRARDKFSGEDSRYDPRYLSWILPPVVLGLLGLVLWWRHGAEIGWWRLAVAVGIPLLIAAVSKAIALFYSRRNAREAQKRRDAQQAQENGHARRTDETSEHPPARVYAGKGDPRMVTRHDDLDSDWMPSLGHSLPAANPDTEERIEREQRIASVRTAGDALAVAVVAVTGLGLIRAFTAPSLPGLTDARYAAASTVAVALGVAVAVVSWPVANGKVRDLLRGLADRAAGPSAWYRPAAWLADWARQQETPRESSSWPWLIFGAPFLIAVVLLVFLPLWTSHWLGVLGTTVIAIGTLAVGLAVLAYLAQTRRPLPLFRIIRLNVTPVITLIVVIGLIGSFVDSRSLLHQVRGPVATASASGRAPLLADLQSWLASPETAPCAVSAAGETAGSGRPVQIEPIVLVAAAGGGIRAAWWAEHALADIANRQCGPHDVFAVSSVSGGSVGTAVVDSASTSQADADINKIAGPDALAAGIDGLLLHDLIAGFTGLDLPAAQLPPGARFSDRADLIETAWQDDDDSSLEQPFPLSQPTLPWRLLFNSTDANTGCRAIIADRLLPVPPGSQDTTGLTCDLRSAATGSGSFDFFTRLPCMQDIATATAAMLSARFPYITPSGVITSCSNKNAIAGQFVDGGYVDSSGLLTVTDVLPSLTAALRVYNTAALAQTQPGQPVTLVVPVVVYLGNSPRPDPAAFTGPSLIQEPSVPLDAGSTAGAQLAMSDTLLQRIQGLLAAGQWLQCVPGLTGCATAMSAAEKTIPDQIIFVSPRTEPAISAPLGWVLSEASRTTLNTDLAEAEDPNMRCVQLPQPKACLPGIGRMADLFLLTRK